MIFGKAVEVCPNNTITNHSVYCHAAYKSFCKSFHKFIQIMRAKKKKTFHIISNRMFGVATRTLATTIGDAATECRISHSTNQSRKYFIKNTCYTKIQFFDTMKFRVFQSTSTIKSIFRLLQTRGFQLLTFAIASRLPNQFILLKVFTCKLLNGFIYIYSATKCVQYFTQTRQYLP